MTRRIVWLTCFAVLVAVGAQMVEYSETMKVELLRVAGIGLLAMSLARGGELRSRLRSPLDVAVLSWVAVEILATLFSSAPLLSVFGEQEQHEGLLTSLAFAGVYAAVRLDAHEPADARRTLEVWFAGAGVASVWACLQALGVVSIGADHAQLGGVMRPFGTLGHPNLLGVITASAAVAAFARARVEDSRRLLHVMAFAVFAAATAITFSRGAWLALGAGLIVAAALAVRVRATRPLPRGAWIAAGLIFVAVAGVAMIGGWGDAFVSRLHELVSPASGSSRSRLEIWRAALSAWRARPLLGWGPDTFGLVSQQFQTPGYWLSAWGEVAVHAHSILLQTLATRGALGLLAGLAIAGTLAIALRDSWRRGGAAAGQAIVHAGAFAALFVSGLFGAWGIAGALLATVLGAHAASAADADERAAAPARVAAKSTRRTRHPMPNAGVQPALTVAGIAGIAAALVMATFAANELMGSRAIATTLLGLRDVMNARGPEAQSELSAIVADAARATRQLPWDDHAPRLGATALMQWAGDWPDPGPLLAGAETAARTAIQRAPQRAANHQCLADVLLRRSMNGEPVASAAWDSSYALAARLWPSNPYVLAGWARARSAMGYLEEAREPAALLRRRYRGSGLAELVHAEVTLARGDTLTARQVIDGSANAEWHGDMASLKRAERLSRALAARN